MELPTLVQRNGEQPLELSAEWRHILQAYAELQRRDANAETRTWRAEGVTLVLVGLLVLTISVGLWLYLHGRQVQAFVQVVQVDSQGQLVQQGIPLDLLAYQPADGIFMEMLGQWVIKTRWRDGEASKVMARGNWAWAYIHTCGQARRLLQAQEEAEQPFKPSKKMVSVELKSVTKIPSPESYQLLWAESSTDPANPQVKTQLYSGTFTIGRYRPATLADTLENRLGLCVTSYDTTPVAPQPS